MTCNGWIGGQPMGPSVDSCDFVEEVDDSRSSQTFTPAKTLQGGIPGSETRKSVVGDGGFDSCEVVFAKDNVSVHPARYARERINDLLRLTKLGTSLFLTWIPPPPFDAGGRRGSADWRTAEKDKNWHTIRAVSLAEIRSIRRHTPSVGLHYIIISPTSGVSFPPFYFHAGGVKEFFATLRNHALLVRSLLWENLYGSRKKKQAGFVHFYRVFTDRKSNDDPSVYFVNSVHVQSREKETKERTPKNEIKEEDQEMEKKEKDVEPEKGPVPVGWADGRYGSPPLSPMCHLDTPSRKRLRRSIALRRLDGPTAEQVSSSFHPTRNKDKEADTKMVKEETFDKEATFFDKEVQVVGPPCSSPELFAGNAGPSQEHLDTLSRKRLRRSIARNIPSLPPPKEEIVLKFSTSFHPIIHGRNPGKYFELVLPRVAGDDTSVCSRQRKTVDLVLSPVSAECSHADIAPTSPHSLPAVEPERSPRPRTFAGTLLQSPLSGKLCGTDATPSSAVDGVEHFSSLFCSGGFREGVALPVSWRNRLHFAELSSEECALVRRRRESWLGTCLSVSVTTNIPIPVIYLLFTSELFMRLMADSGLTYKALHSLKDVNKFGVLKHATCGDICLYLKTFFSKSIRNRRRWERVGRVISGGVVDKGSDEQGSAVQQLAHEEPLSTSFIVPIQHPPGVSQANGTREKPARRWVQRSARAVLREVFVDWGCRQITQDETVALAARFHGNPDAMQIMQLFRNWAHLNCRRDRTPGNSTSHAQPTAGCRLRKRTEAANSAQDAPQSPPPEKKPFVPHNNSSLQSESEPSAMEEDALILAREALLLTFQEKGYREITIDEAVALAVGFRGSPNASQIHLLFGKWAQEKRRRDKVAKDATNEPVPLITSDEQLITYRQALHRTRLAEAARRREEISIAFMEKRSRRSPLS